jgi:hypothetical protein
MRILFIFILIFIQPAFSQDERYFRELFSGELTQEKRKVQKTYKWMANSPIYEIDLGSNKYPESLVIEKKDGEDWIHIHDDKKNRIFSFHFDVNGKDSLVYRISKKRISNITDLLIIYYYEGNTDYRNFSGSVRLYFLTVDNRDLSTISVHKGPVYWDEREVPGGKYSQKKFGVELIDFNHDGIMEIAIGAKYLSRVYFYKSKGKWVGV